MSYLVKYILISRVTPDARLDQVLAFDLELVEVGCAPATVHVIPSDELQRVLFVEFFYDFSKAFGV